MSKREFLLRHYYIIKALRQAPSGFEHVLAILEKSSEIHGYDLSVSKRTFQRDLDDIRILYGIDVAYDFSTHVYSISADSDPGLIEKLLESFDIFNALGISESLSSALDFGTRKSPGTEYIFPLLTAIRDRRVTTFLYRKFSEAAVSSRQAYPYALKEFRHRWYLVAADHSDDMIKCFSLDRMSEISLSAGKFSIPGDFNAKEYFRHCFGIIRPYDDEPCEIVLSFTPEQGKYISSLPLHSSQTILAQSEDELRLRLFLYITHDFIMELLSFGDSVKVISPAILADELKRIYRDALSQY